MLIIFPRQSWYYKLIKLYTMTCREIMYYLIVFWVQKPYPNQTLVLTLTPRPRCLLIVSRSNTCLILFKLEITIARECCLKGTDWKLAFGSSVSEIENICACVLQPELQASYTHNTYNNVLLVIKCPLKPWEQILPRSSGEIRSQSMG